MRVQHFFDAATASLGYVVWDEASRVGVVIDPVLGFDLENGSVSTDPAREILAFIDRQSLAIPFVLDTHAHADHLSGLGYFRRHCGATTAIGEGVTEVQAAARALGLLDPAFSCDGSQFDLLLEEAVPLVAGSFEIEPLHTPGPTRGSVSYRIGDLLFVGDLILQPDRGTGRCDLPTGSAEDLYDSLYRVYRDLPDTTRLFTGHDEPRGRGLAFESTLWEQREGNVDRDAFSRREEFIAFRKERDAGLEPPRLFAHALRFNLRGAPFQG